MKYTFADTSFYVATTNKRDALHAHAMALAEQLDGQILTTDFVVVELGNFFSDSPDRQSFLNLMSDFESDPWTTVLPATRELLRRGVELFSRRPDKDWPVTECISFVVMEDHGLTEALTADRHFAQAEFVPLLA